MIAVREDLVLARQEGPARVHEVDARQVVLLSDLLGAQVLFDGERVVRAAFHRRIVRHDHALDVVDPADADDQSCRRHFVAVDAVCGELPDLQEWGIIIGQGRDPVARQ